MNTSVPTEDQQRKGAGVAAFFACFNLSRDRPAECEPYWASISSLCWSEILSRLENLRNSYIESYCMFLSMFGQSISAGCAECVCPLVQ